MITLTNQVQEINMSPNNRDHHNGNNKKLAIFYDHPEWFKPSAGTQTGHKLYLAIYGLFEGYWGQRAQWL
jgi:hypothetical protein